MLFLVGVAISYVCSENYLTVIAALVSGLLVFSIVNKYFINLNEISLHNFYRDRLSRAYLLYYNPQHRPKTSAVDAVRLSRLKPERGPYHIVNTTLNLSRKMPGANGEGIFRNGESFVLTRNWCGSNQTGYCRTAKYEMADKHIDLGTAMAISGA